MIDRIETRQKPLCLPFACLLAASSGIALIIPFLFDGLYPVAFVALVPLLFAIRNQGLARAALLGFVAGACGHLLGLYWLIGTMMLFGGIPLALSLLFYVVITLAFGTMFVPFTLACRLANDRFRSGISVALFTAAAYTASEFVFPSVFPWRLGYTLAEVQVLVQIADLTGVYGVSFMLALVNAVVLELYLGLVRRPRVVPWPGLAVAACLFLAAALYGMLRLDTVNNLLSNAPVVRVALLQPAVDIREKFIPELGPRHTRDLFDMSLAAANDQQATLVIWPETGYRNLYWNERDQIHVPEGFPETAWLFVGVNIIEDSGDGYRYYNSSLVLDNQGDILGRYDKHRLFPFGEYLPMSDQFPGLKRLGRILHISDFSAGSGDPVLAFPDGTVIGPLICYEDIFPDHSREAVGMGAGILVNITNDAWFTDNSWFASGTLTGKATAPLQHLQLARFRSIENRVPMVRATNDGLTAVVDAAGRLTAAAPLFTRSSLVLDIPVIHLQTFYTRFGDIFVILCLLAVTGVLLFKRKSPGAMPENET